MKRYKIIKNFKKMQKQAVKQNPIHKLRQSIVNYANHDTIWSLPFISMDEHSTDLAVTQNLDKLCNNERHSAIKLARNSIRHFSIDFRKELEPYFKKRQPIYWQAIISDVSVTKGTKKGYILLNHVLMRQFDKDDFSLAFSDTADQIDYHLWLSVDQIKYFGKKKEQYIAIGDVITGQSFIERYRDENNQIHYSLGKTIIDHCGIPLIDGYYLNQAEIKAENARIIDNYDREGDWVIKLQYPVYYQGILGRYKNVNMKTLQFIKGEIRSYYKTSKYSKFYDLNKEICKFKNYDDLADAIEGKNQR